MPDTGGHVTGGVKVLSESLAQTMGFMSFFELCGPILILIITKTGTEIQHYHTCITALLKSCHDIYYSFHRVRLCQKLAFDFPL